jgi:YD repeat-containing protein
METAQEAVDQTIERTVDETGNILETTLNENGEVIGEDLVGNIADLPIQEEYIDDEGRVVSRVQDDSGNVYEQVLDDEGNLVEVRGA